MYRRWIVPSVIRKSKRVITVSNFEKERIKKHFGFNDNRLVAIHNGVSEHFKKVTNTEHLKAVKEQYNLPDKFLFFLGNTDPKKNTRGVLQAFHEFNLVHKGTYKLVMLDYKESELKKLLRYIGNPELIDLIHLVGYVKNTDLPAIINQCTVFLYPSLRESFGIPILEAMACGVPVITSNTSSMPEIAGSKAAMIIDPYKPNEISAALQRIVQDKVLSELLATQGISRAKKFSWKTMAENVLKLYEEVYVELEN